MEHFLVILVCQKCQKCKNSEKPGFRGNCGYISKSVRSIFMIFWHKTPLTINKRMAKFFFQNFLPFLRKNQLCKKLKFLKNLFFYSFEILNFQALSEIFEVFLRLEGLNQKLLQRKKVLELNFMVLFSKM